MLSIAISIPVIITSIATVLINEKYEPMVMQKIGYSDRLKEYTKKFDWSNRMSSPIIVAKEKVIKNRLKEIGYSENFDIEIVN